MPNNCWTAGGMCGYVSIFARVFCTQQFFWNILSVAWLQAIFVSPFFPVRRIRKVCLWPSPIQDRIIISLCKPIISMPLLIREPSLWVRSGSSNASCVRLQPLRYEYTESFFLRDGVICLFCTWTPWPVIPGWSHNDQSNCHMSLKRRQ